jgi:hypothetical protein
MPAGGFRRHKYYLFSSIRWIISFTDLRRLAEDSALLGHVDVRLHVVEVAAKRADEDRPEDADAPLFARSITS